MWRCPCGGCSALARSRLRLRSASEYGMVCRMGGMYRMQDLLKLLVQEGGDELRLAPGRPPVMVLHGSARLMDGGLVTSDDIAELFHSIATAEQNQELTRCGDSHFILPTEHSGRFKISASMEGEELNLTVRSLSR
jgi:Tfp pilus assembly ATPase PilU